MAALALAQGLRRPRASPIYQVICGQEETRYLVPRGYFEIGLGMCMPTLFTLRAPRQQKRRYAPPGAARRRDLVSALQRARRPAPTSPALRTRAERDGDDWVDQRPEDLDVRRALRGLWHPRDAHRSERGEAQGADVLLPRHEVARASRPADQADLRAIALQRGVLHRRAHSRRQRLGAVGQGWGVAITTLMNERLAVGRRSRPGLRRDLRARAHGRARRRPGDRELRGARAARRLVRASRRACGGRASGR